MNGMHDMGGMHGFGPIEREENAPVFHHAWEGRVFAPQQATPVPIPGGSRNMEPAAYLTSSYSEKWLHARIKGLIDAGGLLPEALEARVTWYRHHPEAPGPHNRAYPQATTSAGLQRWRRLPLPRAW